MNYNMDQEAVIARFFIEDPSLDKLTKLSPIYNNVTVKNELIEETKSYYPSMKMMMTTDGYFYSRFFIELCPVPYNPTNLSVSLVTV